MMVTNMLRLNLLILLLLLLLLTNNVLLQLLRLTTDAVFQLLHYVISAYNQPEITVGICGYTMVCTYFHLLFAIHTTTVSCLWVWLTFFFSQSIINVVITTF